jgi:transposase
MDEARFGLKSWYRRRWCPRGLRPPWVVADRYEWLWLYAAVEPRSGKSFFLLLPCLDAQCFTLFLQRFRHTRRPKHVGLVLDNSPSHISGQVKWPKGVTPLRLPPCSPELNPVERFFKELRSQLANKAFDNLEALEAPLTYTLRTCRGIGRLSVILPTTPGGGMASNLSRPHGNKRVLPNEFRDLTPTFIAGNINLSETFKE